MFIISYCWHECHKNISASINGLREGGSSALIWESSTGLFVAILWSLWLIREVLETEKKWLRFCSFGGDNPVNVNLEYVWYPQYLLPDKKGWESPHQTLDFTGPFDFEPPRRELEGSSPRRTAAPTAWCVLHRATGNGFFGGTIFGVITIAAQELAEIKHMVWESHVLKSYTPTFFDIGQTHNVTWGWPRVLELVAHQWFMPAELERFLVPMSFRGAGV